MKIPATVLLCFCATTAFSARPQDAGCAAVVLPIALRDSMSTIWRANNRHWDELAGVNTLSQLLGTGRPTQREYLGCLAGEIDHDTLRVEELVPAADLRQLQFAVSGNCDGVDHVVGVWHTHPYRADTAGHALKERGLSPLDLATFAGARDVVTMVMWDADSLDVAVKTPDGKVRGAVPLVTR